MNYKSDDTIVVYTDGGCSGNPGPGAWAYVIMACGKKYSDSGCSKNTTNNRMELIAVIEALKYLKKILINCSAVNIEISTDSQYVKKGITEWILKWEKNGWKNAKKQPVKNYDLWKTLRKLSLEMKPQWKWVQGHSGNSMNEECDQIVKKTIPNCL